MFYVIVLVYGVVFVGSCSCFDGGLCIIVVVLVQGGVSGGQVGFVYVFDWCDYNVSQVLYVLQVWGLKICVVFQLFMVVIVDGEQLFVCGSVVILVVGQLLVGGELLVVVEQVVCDSGVCLYVVVSGQSCSGIDLGSDSVKLLCILVVVLVMGEGVSVIEIGLVWFLFDQQVWLLVSKLDLVQLGKVMLDCYIMIVFVGGIYVGVDVVVVVVLKCWINVGGLLVIYGSVVCWVIEQKFVDEVLGVEEM